MTRRPAPLQECSDFVSQGAHLAGISFFATKLKHKILWVCLVSTAAAAVVVVAMLRRRTCCVLTGFIFQAGTKRQCLEALRGSMANTSS